MNQKKLYKDMSNKMLLGVCAGIGNYLELDANVVRLLFVVFSVFGGMGALIYLVAAIILPEQY